MADLVGYKLVDAQGNVIHQWGGVWGSYPGVPNPIILPNGDAVHAPALNEDYGGYHLVEWLMDPPLFADLLPLQPYQFFAMLTLSGKKAELEAFIDGLPSPQNVIARAKLEHTSEFRRGNELVLTAQAALGLTDQQLNTLWAQAAAIT